MDKDQLEAHLAHRPAVHQLCYNAFLQSPIRIPPGIIAAPLQAFGFNAEANYAARYVREVVGGEVDEAGVRGFAGQADAARPVVTLVCQRQLEAEPQELEQAVRDDLARAREVVSWISTDPVEPFAIIVARSRGVDFRPLAPASRRVRRLGFGNTGDQFQEQVNRLVERADKDERFAYAMSLFRDAMHEPNPRYQVARLFNVLECLAAEVKGETVNGEKLWSRRAIRYLFGFNPDEMALTRETVDGHEYSYDAIETAGQIRQKLFHGIQVDPDELPDAARDGYEVYRESPETLARSLMERCRIELLRRANGASRALEPIGAQDEGEDDE